ncbi:hypothetical protein L6Q79_14380 [bacterium]|nr:hypothetical protein [bacterium]NUN46426.1 hypothetical protein [bacterium]
MKSFFHFSLLIFVFSWIIPLSVYSQSGSYVIDQIEWTEGESAESKLTISIQNGVGKIIEIGNVLNEEIRIVSIEHNAVPLWMTTNQALFEKKVSGTVFVQIVDKRAKIEFNDVLKSGDKLIVKLALAVPTAQALKLLPEKKYNLDVTVRKDHNSNPVKLTNSQTIKVKADAP